MPENQAKKLDKKAKMFAEAGVKVRGKNMGKLVDLREVLRLEK